MTSKKDNSLFKNIFKREDDESEPPSANSELLQCLHNLSSIGEGQDRKVDHEISQFKKMVKIGSPVAELKQQIAIITDTLIQSAKLPENNKLVKMFKQMPAEIMIDEFLNQPLTEAVNNRLQNYRNSLTPGDLATTSISDLIDILETEPAAVAIELENEQGADKSHLKDITSPLLRLFSQLELSDDQNDDLKVMRKQSGEINDLDELCSFLEEISQLILSTFATSAGQFESFLVKLKQHLDTVSRCILTNGETSQAISGVSDTFSQQVSSRVNDIQSSISNAENITDLENVITESLESIVEGVNSFDTERKALEQQSAKTIADLEHELKQTNSEIEYLKDNLQQQRKRALTDPLTKLPNRQAYNERMHLEYNRWRRYRKPLSLIIGDIDFFKKVNDTHGHVAGDTALKDTAQILQQDLRTTDFVARFGGEEFVILMPETDLKSATKAINKIRLKIQSHKVHEGDANFQLTMSFGVAAFDEDDTFKTVLAKADTALYRAKDRGRNQVCAQIKK